MCKWILYTQPNYAHPRPTQTCPFATPSPNEYQQVELMLYLILSLVGFIPKQNTDESPFTRLGKSHDSRFLILSNPYVTSLACLCEIMGR